MHNRKSLSYLVQAANTTFCKALGSGKVIKRYRPGIIATIQTFGNMINWNCHLHLVVSDGAIDYRDIDNIRFIPCFTWNIHAMKQIFRIELLKILIKKKIVSKKTADLC